MAFWEILLAGYSAQSRASKMASSCSFVEIHVTKWGSNDRSFIQETRLEQPNFSNLQKTRNQKTFPLRICPCQTLIFTPNFQNSWQLKTIIVLLGGLRNQDSTAHNIVVGTYLLQTKSKPLQLPATWLKAFIVP